VKKTISSFRELNRHDGPIVETLDSLLVEERALDLGRCDEQSSHESDGPTISQMHTYSGTGTEYTLFLKRNFLTKGRGVNPNPMPVLP